MPLLGRVSSAKDKAQMASKGKSLLKSSMDEVHAQARENADDLVSPIHVQSTDSLPLPGAPGSTPTPEPRENGVESRAKRNSVSFGTVDEVRASELSKQSLTKKSSWFRKSKPDPAALQGPPVHAPPVLKKEPRHNSISRSTPPPAPIPPRVSDEDAKQRLNDIKLRMMASPPTGPGKLPVAEDDAHEVGIAATGNPSPFELELQRRATLTLKRASPNVASRGLPPAPSSAPSLAPKQPDASSTSFSLQPLKSAPLAPSPPEPPTSSPRPPPPQPTLPRVGSFLALESSEINNDLAKRLSGVVQRKQNSLNDEDDWSE